MNLRHVGMLKKEAAVLKNIASEINKTKVENIKPELTVLITNLLQRKQLIEDLNKETLNEKAKETLYKKLDKNNQYFEEMDEYKRQEFGTLFEQVDDHYSRTAEWQNLYMAFVTTANLRSYHVASKFVENFEDLRKRKEVIDVAADEVRKQKDQANKKHPHITPKTAAHDLEKLTKDKNALLEQIKKLEEDSELKKQQAEKDKVSAEKAHKQELDEIDVKKQQVNAKYKIKKEQLELRKLDVEKAYRENAAYKIDPFIIEGKEVYKRAAKRLEEIAYLSYLNPKEYEGIKQENRQKRLDYLSKRDEIAKNATGKFREYLDVPTQKEEADLKIIKKTIGFFLVCKDPLSNVSQKFLDMHPEFAGPSKSIINVGNFLDYVDSIKDNDLSEESKKLVAFAEAFEQSMREFAPLYLKIENPTKEQIDDVVNMFKEGSPTMGRDAIRKVRKPIDTAIEKRRAPILAQFDEKDKKDFELYSAPEPTTISADTLQKSRDNFDSLIASEKFRARNTQQKEISTEEAIANLQYTHDGIIEDVVLRAIRGRTKDLEPGSYEKKYHLNEEKRNGVRYDIWLKEQVKKIEVYEKNLGKVDYQKVKELDEKYENELKQIDLDLQQIEPNRRSEVSALNAQKLFRKPEKHTEKLNSIDAKLKEDLLANEKKIEELKAQITLKEEQMEIAQKFLNPSKHFNMEGLKSALEQQCEGAPKLDLKAVMDEKRAGGIALLKMETVHIGNHKNSAEFNAMINAMSVVTNWGTSYDVTKYSTTGPKSYEEAVGQLKASVKKYVKEKDKQHRPFPTKLRYMRYELAKAFEAYADEQIENLKDIKMDEKEVKKWNDFFESKGEKPLFKETNKSFEKPVNNITDPTLENDNNDFEK